MKENLENIKPLLEKLSLIEQSTIFLEQNKEHISSIIISTPNFTKETFDKITEIVLSFEDNNDKYIDYFYVEDSQIKNKSTLILYQK